MAGVYHPPYPSRGALSITKRYRVTFPALYPLITVNAYSWLDHPITPFIVALFLTASRLSKGTQNR